MTSERHSSDQSFRRALVRPRPWTAIDVDRIDGIVLRIGRRLGTVEDIVARQVDDRRTGLLAGLSENRHGVAVYRKRGQRLGLRTIDRGVSGTVYDDRRHERLQGLSHRALGSDVELRPVRRKDVPAGIDCPARDLAPDLAARAGHQQAPPVRMPALAHVAADEVRTPRRRSGGSPPLTVLHQASLSRYQDTVSLSPSSKLRRGRQPSSRSILPGSIAYLKSCPGRSVTMSISESCGRWGESGRYSSTRAQMACTIFRFERSCRAPTL